MKGIRVKPEYVVLLVLIVALGLAVAFRSGNRVRYKLPELAAVKPEEITRISVRRASEVLELEKREGSWRIQPEGYKADPALVTPMVDALAGLSVAALVSEAESYERYDLDVGSRMDVAAYAGGAVVRQLAVGKQGEGGKSSFVLLPQDKRVWSTQQNLRSLLDKEKEKLRDMTVLSFAMDSIVEIVAKQGDRSLTLKKTTEEGADKQKSTSWQDEAGESWDQDAVSQMLRTLARLRSSRYGERGMDAGRELVNVFLKAEDGTGYTVSFHEKTGSEYPGLSSQSDYPFFVAEYQYQDVADVFKGPAQK